GVGIVEARGTGLLPLNAAMKVRRSLEFLADEAEIAVRAGECAMDLATSRSIGAGRLGWASCRLIRESSRGQRTENRYAYKDFLHSTLQMWGLKATPCFAARGA